MAQQFVLANPRALDGTTLSMSLLSTNTGRLGQVLISVHFVSATFEGLTDTPPELTMEIKKLLTTPGKLKVIEMECDK